MSLTYIFFAIIIIGIALIIWLILKANKSTQEKTLTDIKYKIDSFNAEVARIEAAVKNEMVVNRQEGNTAAKNTREELSGSFKQFSGLISGVMNDTSNLQKTRLETFSTNLNNLTQSVEQKLTALTGSIENKLKEASDTSTVNSKESRKELKESLEIFKIDFSKSVEAFNAAQKDNFFALLGKQSEQNIATSQKLDTMRDTVEKKIAEMQTSNERKLEEMRATVDEKLQKTLETRLGESFKQVSERLEAVHKGLGDMQTLATGVGDLKRVLTNVKSRGVLGEYQLENLLEQLFTPDQYEKNVRTKMGSNATVEFAIKMPGRNDKTVWLPIDSKFPKEDFELLMNAYDHGSAEHIEECRKTFVKGIKKSAGDICGKYIDPPNTTDFAILFLPFESLYAEVLRTPGLFETIQRECKINIAGPTTLSAFLSSLQMGFRTLAIEKRSSEVWQLLGAVKTEFGLFGGILEKTQKKLSEASSSIEQAGVRSRKIERQLKNVQELPKPEVITLLDEVAEIGEQEDISINEEDQRI
jgi:DNA recombination protein RmuC